MTRRYRLYIDESGDHVKRETGETGHRYLCLTGCFFENEEYKRFHRAIEDFKENHFPHSPDEPVILHRKDIINRKGPFWRLRDAERDALFRRDLLSIIEAAVFKIIGVVIDKEMLFEYPAPFHPYHTCLDFMLQRYSGFLNHINGVGDVMVESRGGTEDKLLKNAYRHIFTHGDMHHRAIFYKRVLTTKELKLKRKNENIAGLQLSDLLASAVKKDTLYRYGDIEPLLHTFDNEIRGVIGVKYNKHLYNHRIDGYGRVLFPK